MRSMVEGARHPRIQPPEESGAPSTTAFGGSPPPRSGEEFAGAATRLAGAAGLVFGWVPETFWNATPAELEALVRAFAGEDVAPPGAGEIARLQELFPDG
jgi:hypothetical protein